MLVSREQVFNDIKKYGIEEVKKKVAEMNPVSAPVYDSPHKILGRISSVKTTRRSRYGL